MPLKTYTNYNTNNYHYMAPFQFDESGNLILDSKFYIKIKDTSFHKELLKKFTNINIKDNIRYKQNINLLPIDSPVRKRFFIVYNTFLEWYNSYNWSHVLSRPIRNVAYTDSEKKNMIEISKVMIPGLRYNFSTEQTESLSDLIERLDEAINICGDIDKCNGCFIKLASGSVKHDYPIEEIFTGKRALEHLLPSKRVFRNINDGYILVQPWNDNIKLFREFRVFIEDNKVIGITQQAIYEIYQECITIYSKMTQEIVEQAQKLWDNIKDMLEYQDATLDVWLNSNNEMDLIEINAYGGWSAAGSGWFDWENDFPDVNKINSLNDVEVRFTYPDNYFT